MTTIAKYKSPRLTKPSVVNTYAAIEETFRYQFTNGETEVANILYVRGVDNGMDELQSFEPRCTANNWINTNSKLCWAMYEQYDEFRVRSITCRITSQVLNPTNVPRSDVWVWWCPNHYEEDEDSKIGDTFSTVTDMSEAARVQHLTVVPGKSFTINYIPQMNMVQQAYTTASTVINSYGDQPSPWLRTTQDNLDNIMLRAPIFYFRKPFNIPATNQVYNVMLIAIIEFRSLDDDN